MALLRALAKRLECPLVIDADGLQAFAAEPAMLRARSAPTVLTPHPGEAARLLGTNAAAVNRDRIGAARALADATGAVTLLKGAATIVVEPEGRTIVNPTGGRPPLRWSLKNSFWVHVTEKMPSGPDLFH